MNSRFCCEVEKGGFATVRAMPITPENRSKDVSIRVT